jgi:vancomycin permeability regulator SanA
MSQVIEAEALVVAGIVLVLGVAFALVAAWTWWRVARTTRSSSPPGRADAIVVLGAEAFAHRPCSELQARLDHAAELWRAGTARRIVCSGGWDGTVCEPEVMARALVQAGVPGSAVEVDDRGTCTRATIAVASDYARVGAAQVVLVSSPYHLYRLSVEARRMGLAASVSAPATTPITRNRGHLARQRAREVVAIWRVWMRRASRPRARRASLGPVRDPALAGVQAWRA